MKICMLISKIEPSENGVYVGGSVNALLTLLKQFGLDNIPVKVLTSLNINKHLLFKKYLPEGADFTVFKNNGRAQSAMFGVVFALKSALWALFIGRGKYDIIHGHSGYAIYAWVTYFVAFIIGARPVHTVYCPIQTKGTVDNTARFLLKGKLALFALNKMDVVIAMSENIAVSLINAGVARDKISVMPTAVDTERFRPRQSNNEIRAQLKLNNDDLLVVFVGNLMKSKGLDVLVEAVGKIYKQFPNIKLILTLELKHTGFDERAQLLKKQIDELGLSDSVLELGMINFMPELISEADVIVSPYRDTQGPSDFPLAMMEAMASARCVVGTTVGGMPELVRDGVNGMLAIAGDAGSLANTLAELLEDSNLRRELGIKAREKILSSYSPKRVADDHLEMYKKVMT